MEEKKIYDIEKIEEDIRKMRGYSIRELVRSIFVGTYLETLDLSDLKLLDEKLDEIIEACKELYIISRIERNLEKAREECSRLEISEKSQERLVECARKDYEKVMSKVLVLFGKGE